MIEQLSQHAMSLGISGLLFVMWWYERQERTRGAANAIEAAQVSKRLAELDGQLLDVIRSNTAAVVALREELGAQARAARDWIAQVSQRIERLANR